MPHFILVYTVCVPYNRFLSIKGKIIVIIFLINVKSIFVDTKNGDHSTHDVAATVLLSTHSICFGCYYVLLHASFAFQYSERIEMLFKTSDLHTAFFSFGMGYLIVLISASY